MKSEKEIREVHDLIGWAIPRVIQDQQSYITLLPVYVMLCWILDHCENNVKHTDELINDLKQAKQIVEEIQKASSN